MGGVAALAGKDAASALPGVGVMVVLSVVGLAVSGFVAYAGWQMRQMQGWGLAMAGAIVAMIPCISPCCLLGIPIGIWAILVLIDDEVKQAFAQGGNFGPPPGGYTPPPGPPTRTSTGIIVVRASRSPMMQAWRSCTSVPTSCSGDDILNDCDRLGRNAWISASTIGK